MMHRQTITAKDGKKYEVNRRDNDINGNPIYSIYWLSLKGLKSPESTKETRKAGLRKAQEGVFTFQSYNLVSSINFFIDCGLIK